MDDLEKRIRMIASRVVAWNQQSMARLKMVVDENRTGGLVQALDAYNFKVKSVGLGSPDPKIAEGLYKSVLVTNNTRDFLELAPIYEFSIIALEGLSFIDSEPTAENKTAKVIHRAVVDFALKSKHSPFVLYLKDDGNHILTDLS